MGFVFDSYVIDLVQALVLAYNCLAIKKTFQGQMLFFFSFLIPYQQMIEKGLRPYLTFRNFKDVIHQNRFVSDSSACFAVSIKPQILTNVSFTLSERSVCHLFSIYLLVRHGRLSFRQNALQFFSVSNNFPIRTRVCWLRYNFSKAFDVYLFFLFFFCYLLLWSDYFSLLYSVLCCAVLVLLVSYCLCLTLGFSQYQCHSLDDSPSRNVVLVQNLVLDPMRYF